jgi:hypothetical protein
MCRESQLSSGKRWLDVDISDGDGDTETNKVLVESILLLSPRALYPSAVYAQQSGAVFVLEVLG